jgi:uncharacterized membrane protein YGL010W
MKSIQQWLGEYGESHQNSTNKLIHWICVPTIYFTIVGLLYSIPLQFGEIAGLKINIGSILAVVVFIYYCMLSIKVAIGMLFITTLCLVLSEWIFQVTGGNLGLAITCLILFTISWILQFWGHHIEGKKPSFIKDLQYLMIGPAWVISFFYKKIGIEL